MDMMDIPELIPIEEYDVQKACLEASVRWVLGKAYGRNIPSDCDPVTIDTQKGGYSLAPGVVRVFTSSEAYCKLAANVLTDNTTCIGHVDVIQNLSKRGFYVLDETENAITDSQLQQASPLDVNAHLGLIRAFMTCHATHILAVERVVQAVRKYSVVNASTDLPTSTDSAAVFWINKVCATVRQRIAKSIQTTESQEVVPDLPVIEELLRDVNDGCCLATVVSFYCPQVLELKNIVLESGPGIADSLYNIQLLLDFGSRHLPAPCSHHLTINDLFYTRVELYENVLVFIAELFNCLEVAPVGGVRDVSQPLHIGADLRATSLQPDRSKPLLPISSATKRSFHSDLQGPPSSGSTPDLIRDSSALPPPRQPLLPKRIQQKSDDGRQGPPRESIRAWEDNQVQPQASFGEPELTSGSATGRSSNLLENVSIDSEASMDFGESSVDLSELDTPRPVGPVVKTKNIVGGPARSSGGNDVSTSRSKQLEPLMPARVKPAKEKSSLHPKDVESGERSEKQSPMSSMPQKPLSLALTNNHDKPASDSDSTPDEDYQTPSVESVPFVVAASTTTTTAPSAAQPMVTNATTKPKQFEAFYVDTDSMPLSGRSVQASIDRHKPSSGTPLPSSSFTLHDQPYTARTAKAAGIPVLDSTENVNHRNSVLRRDHRNSMESSDPELRKIHAENNTKEATKPVKDPIRDTFFFNSEQEASGSSSSVGRPGSLGVQKPVRMDISQNGNAQADELESPQTSFAQIKRQKDNGEVSSVFHLHGTSGRGAAQHGNPRGATPKKTTFAALPNQTTWLENAQQRAAEVDANKENEAEPVPPLATDLHRLRLKLEERRKQIESDKRRMEQQWSKQRQRLGKQAFIQVVAKKDNRRNSLPEENENEPTRPDPSARLTASDHVDLITDREPILNAGRSRSQSPQVAGSPSPQQPSEGEPGSRKSMTREDIQDTIEAVKQRWFKDDASTKDSSSSREGSVQRERPGSGSSREKSATPPASTVKDKTPPLPAPVHSRPEVLAAVSSKTDTSPPVASTLPLSKPRADSSASASGGDSDSQTSLDRLNTSLSELQNEIMRLSIQQEQIKKANEPNTITTPSSVTPVHTTMAASPPRQDPFAAGAYMNSRTGEPDLAGGIRAYPQASLPYQGQPQYAMQHQPYMPQGHYPGQYMPTTQAPYGMPQFPPAGQYAHMYPPAAPHIYGGAPPVSMPPHQWGPYGGAPAPAIASQPSPVRSNVPAQTVPPTTQVQSLISASAAVSSSISSDMREGSPPGGAGYMDSIASPNASDYSSPEKSPSAFYEGSPTKPSCDEHEESDQSRVEDSSNEEGMTSKRAPFFISFEEPAAGGKQKPKQRPKLFSQKKEATQSSTETPPKSEASKSAPPATPESQKAPAESSPPVNVIASPPVALVIDTDSDSMEQSGPEEIEKRKQKFMAAQIKRREEQERKRAKQENEMARKREQQMLKKEQVEQKKAEEKSKRDAIFQDYLKRKAEREIAEEESKAGMTPSVQRRTKPAGKPKKTRPTSQPPTMSMASHAAAESNSHSSHSHSSQEDLSNKYCFMSDHMDGSSLAYGGLTHRRPPSPGPKLFVKPSAKSNKHIIKNAISHCVLAGTVNNDTKHSVLEEVDSSAAKHFVILFRDAQQQYRGVYGYYPEQQILTKVIGVGPKQLTDTMIERFYKYNSGGKSFMEITNMKHMSVSVDAVVLQNHLWQKKVPQGKKPPGPVY